MDYGFDIQFLDNNFCEITYESLYLVFTSIIAATGMFSIDLTMSETVHTILSPYIKNIQSGLYYDISSVC